jgi:hypothetical protein
VSAPSSAQFEFIVKRRRTATLLYFKGFVDHCHPADLLADGCLDPFLAWCQEGKGSPVNQEDGKIEAEIYDRICGKLESIARSDGEKELIQRMRKVLGAEPSITPAIDSAGGPLMERSQLALAVQRVLIALKPGEETGKDPDKWLSSIMTSRETDSPHGFPWFSGGATVSLTTRIVDAHYDEGTLYYLEEEQSLALRNALGKASKEHRLALYPKLHQSPVFPSKLSMNEATLGEIKGPDRDDLRWFILSGWLAEGWSGQSAVLDSLPKMKAYLENLPAPQKTDFLIYRRVLNLMAAHEQGALTDRMGHDDE